jgi:hypothetical protein
MSDKLQEIKDYCKHYDYLDYVNLKDLNWLIEQAEKVERYEKALKFYADKENYEEWNEDLGLTEYIHNADFDGGDIAREALDKAEKENKNG